MRFVDDELCKHVHKKLEWSQNEDGDNYKSLWQGESNHFLVLVLCRIVFSLERQLSLHVLSLSKHVTIIWMS
jgi:hypothetical protein